MVSRKRVPEEGQVRLSGFDNLLVSPSSPFRDDRDVVSVSEDSVQGGVRLRFNNLKWWSRPSAYALLPAFFLGTVAQGALIAPALNLVLELVCRANYASVNATDGEDFDRDCQTAEMHAKVSRFMMIVALIQGILAALVSPKLGALSDRIGRKPIITMSSVGPLISGTILLIAAKSSSPHAYLWFLVSPVLDGLSGSATTMMLTTHAYASDCTPPAQRAKVFGMLRACLFCGIALGPALGAVFLQLTDNLLSVFYVALATQLLIIAFFACVLPESRSRESIIDAQDAHRIDAEFEAAGTHDMRYYARKMNFLKPLRMLWPNDGTRYIVKRNILVLALIETVLMGTGYGSVLTILLYAEFTFHWRSEEAGYFISLAGVTRVMALVIALPIISHYHAKYRPHIQHEVGATKADVFLIRVGVLCEMMAFVLMGLSRNSLEFAAASAAGALGSMSSPTINSALTKHVAKENTGALLGSLSLVQSISTIITPVIFSNIYALTVGSHPRTIFVVVSAMLGVAFVLSLMVREHVDGGLYDSGDGVDGTDSLRDNLNPRDDYSAMELDSEVETEYVWPASGGGEDE
ncbi:major facilitator superfamily domain-containing protein [Lipomyces arxii]|uniref:major facilitator superfamily domain-containing protein n=1 Tax=Lipomyces arxii TaxID=56418 RepID=UPI0034CEA3FD